MALFKCLNCGTTFVVHIVYPDELRKVRCPKCGSRWVKYIGTPTPPDLWRGLSKWDRVYGRAWEVSNKWDRVYAIH